MMPGRRLPVPRKSVCKVELQDLKFIPPQVVKRWCFPVSRDIMAAGDFWDLQERLESSWSDIMEK
ncbi:hypothetical protein V5799_014658, partial [Amblyomma americanum]